MSTQNAFDFDTPQHALSHRGGPSTEREALVSLNVPELEQKTLRVIAVAGTRGATLKDVCRALGKEKNSISGRLTWLENKHQIKWNGEKRERCRVFVTYETKLSCDCGVPAEDGSFLCYGCAKAHYE